MVCRPPKPVSVKAHTSSGAAVKTHCRGNRGGAKSQEPEPARKKGVGVGARKGKLSDAVLKGIGKAPAKKAPAKKAPSKPKGEKLSKNSSDIITIKKMLELGSGTLEDKATDYAKGILARAGIGISGDKYVNLPAKKAPAKKAPAKKAPAKKAPAKKQEKMPKELLLSFQQGGKITDAEGKTVKRKDRADKGKKKMPKKKAPPVPPRPAGRPGARSYASVAGAKTRVGQTKGRLSGAVAGSLAAARRKKQAQTNPSQGYA